MGNGELSAVTLGGKGSSLSSSSVYAVATGRSQTRIHSSALDRLSSPASLAHKITIVIPDFLTLEESRAFLIVLLNKLIICNSPSRIPQCITEALNSNLQSFKFEEFDVTEEEHTVLVDKTCSALLGVSAILDYYQSTALSTFADVAASFSCEALRTDRTVFNLMDSGDGLTSKEEVGFSNDMRDLLGKEAIPSVIQIPEVHGAIREQAKLVHSKMHVELNSGHKLRKCEVGGEKAVCSVLLSLAEALEELGECSFARAQRNLVSIDSNDLKSNLGEIFGKECPTNANLRSCYYETINLNFRKYYDAFAHEINVLFGLVWKIVAWEFVTAYAVLDVSEIQDVQGNGESSKVDKKQKKDVLGKTANFILPLIKGRLQSEKQGGVENSRRLEILVTGLLSFFDLAKPEFNEFLLKIKDYDESREFPKIPKVSTQLYHILAVKQKLCLNIFIDDISIQCI